MELKEGDKYLSIRLDIGVALAEAFKAIKEGRESVALAAFKHEATKDTDPVYRSKGVAVWENTKKSQIEEKEAL